MLQNCAAACRLCLLQGTNMMGGWYSMDDCTLVFHSRQIKNLIRMVQYIWQMWKSTLMANWNAMYKPLYLNLLGDVVQVDHILYACIITNPIIKTSFDSFLGRVMYHRNKRRMIKYGIIWCCTSMWKICTLVQGQHSEESEAIQTVIYGSNSRYHTVISWTMCVMNYYAKNLVLVYVDDKEERMRMRYISRTLLFIKNWWAWGLFILSTLLYSKRSAYSSSKAPYEDILTLFIHITPTK